MERLVEPDGVSVELSQDRSAPETWRRGCGRCRGNGKMPHNMRSVIPQFHDGIRACVRLDGGVCSGWFAVEQGLRQGCVLASLLFNIFLAAVINVAYTCFKADKDIMDVWCTRKSKGGREEANAGEPVLATLLWGMLYADDAGVVSPSPEQLRKMMGVTLVVCAAFGLTVSEAKTEIICLRTKGMPESTATFGVEEAGQVYNQTNSFVDFGGNVDLFIEVDQRMRNAWCSFRKYTLKLYNRPSASLKFKIRMLRAVDLRQRCAVASCGARARATTTRFAELTTAS